MVENICLYKYGKTFDVALNHAYKYTKEQYVTDKQAGKTIITDIIGGKESISRGSLIEDVKIDFGDLKNRKILINFESPMCKRIVCEL